MALALGLLLLFRIAFLFYFRDFYGSAEQAFAVPGLSDAFVPQGMEAWEGSFLLSGYQADSGEARLVWLDTDGSDRTKIASVIYNRLNDSGSHGTYRMLNIDAALLYALPDHEGALTNVDKKVDSPYNLYTHAGLPPTPIANPGIASIDAALRPETTDYYYYALGKDGKHHFSNTLSEHNAFLNSGEYGG